MEGLIPMVYKSLKQNKTRSRYERLSPGAAQAEDLYVRGEDDNGRFARNRYSMPESGGVSGGARHRRYNSDKLRGFGSEHDRYRAKQLVRFRSNRMLSCLTGA